MDPDTGDQDASAVNLTGGPLACELDGITMSFGANEVLKGVTLDSRCGHVTALLGANGAGKSTLIKVLSGVYPEHGGEIRVAGNPVEMESPLAAARHGIQTVHQRIDETIVPGLTVAENLVFEEIVRGEVPTVRSLRKLLPRAREIAADPRPGLVGLDAHPRRLRARHRRLPDAAAGPRAGASGPRCSCSTSRPRRCPPARSTGSSP